jgi:hypothetical protein
LFSTGGWVSKPNSKDYTSLAKIKNLGLQSASTNYTLGSGRMQSYSTTASRVRSVNRG